MKGVMKAIIFRGSVALSLSALLAGCASQGAAPTPTLASSSYACQTTAFAGLRSEGEGPYGCYFQLLHPGDKKVLANTPYHLLVFAPGGGNKVVRKVEGVTDQQGRSVFVKTPFPITPDKMRFVQAIGKGDYGRSFQLVRPTDGRFVPFNPYHVKGCGLDYEGLTDEQGHTVLGQCESAQQIKVDFLSKNP